MLRIRNERGYGEDSDILEIGAGTNLAKPNKPFYDAEYSDENNIQIKWEKITSIDLAISGYILKYSLNETNEFKIIYDGMNNTEKNFYRIEEKDLI